MISLSHYLTFKLGVWFPTSIPLVYVLGYPKSGTTWACQLVADYLRLPFPQHAIIPVGFPAVVHGHESVTKKYPVGVYIVRDGRDVLVSGFHHLKGQFEVGGGKRVHKNYFKNQDLDRPVSELLPSFIKHSVKHPFACKLHWGAHVGSYFKSKNPNMAIVQYERLLSEPEQELSSLIANLSGREVDQERIKEALNRFSFARQSGKKSDEPVKGSFLRKGKSGDWKNFFNRQSAELFHQHFGEALISAGYEEDPSWVEKVELTN